MNYATSFPAASMSDDYLDRVVTQGHADYCAERGHATYTKDDVVQDFCPRCGAVTAEQEQVTPTGTIPNEGDLYPFTTSYGKDTIIERVTSTPYTCPTCGYHTKFGNAPRIQLHVTVSHGGAK